MFWSLPQALRGHLSLLRATVGVLWLGSFLISLLLALAILAFALPSRSESLVLLAWLLQSAYVFLACFGVWRSARNGETRLSRSLARAVAVIFCGAQAWLLWHLFGTDVWGILARAYI
jgi:hypothetical protein